MTPGSQGLQVISFMWDKEQFVLVWLDLHEGRLGWGLGSFKLIPYFLFSDRPGEAGEQPVGH